MERDGDAPALRGTVERLTFQNPENGYTVARLVGERGDAVVVVGTLPGVQEGDALELAGRWVEHPRFGRQFQVTGHRVSLPSSLEGVRRYLASGRIAGIGDQLAARIVDRFGEHTLEVIEREPERLREVPGLGPKKIERLLASWRRHQADRDLTIFLRSLAIGPGLTARIMAHYGQRAAVVVRQNPFRLAEEVPGIGFLTADAIARKVGLDPASPERLRAGLLYLLARAADEGHVFVARDELLERADGLLAAGWHPLAEMLDTMGRDGALELESERCYLPVLHRAETSVAQAFVRLTSGPPVRRLPDAAAFVREIESAVGMDYESAQREAIARALQSRVLVLTGGPGTGKTTVVLGVIEGAERLGWRVALAAPTGRAAKRMTEVSGRPARTIHRLLEYGPREGLFRRNRERPLEANLLVVDESSMIDLPLMDHLLAALGPNASVLLVGDADQLPSVGVGNVLRDVIASGAVEVVRLQHVFRQAESSAIVRNAHRINQGLYPELRADNSAGRDFFMLEEEDPEKAAALVADLAAERLPSRYGFDPLLDVQVLTPMHRGAAGAQQLNQLLQERLNPQGAEIARGAPRLRVGDKVMQVRNNYDREVFNGDLGVVARLDPAAETVWVRFDELVPYPYGELDEIVLAYAITVHKSQGSEYRAVVLPLVMQHYIMLQRNLLYTAVTRARDLVVVVGSKRALGMAVRNDRIDRRNSALVERLTG